MSMTRRQLLILLPAAAVAWEYILAGTPEDAPNYQMSEHWWAMLIDLTKCIGCGSCVRGCQNENQVPDGYYRTWVERYHVEDLRDGISQGRLARRRQERFPCAERNWRQKLLCAQALQSLRRFAVHAGLSGGRDVRYARWCGAGRSEVLPRMPLLHPSLPVRLPLH